MSAPVCSLYVLPLVQHRRVKRSTIWSMKNPLKNTCADALSAPDLLWSDEARWGKGRPWTYCLSTSLCSTAQKKQLRALHCRVWWCWSTETKEGEERKFDKLHVKLRKDRYHGLASFCYYWQIRRIVDCGIQMWKCVNLWTLRKVRIQRTKSNSSNQKSVGSDELFRCLANPLLNKECPDRLLKAFILADLVDFKSKLQLSWQSSRDDENNFTDYFSEFEVANDNHGRYQTPAYGTFKDPLLNCKNQMAYRQF